MKTMEINFEDILHDEVLMQDERIKGLVEEIQMMTQNEGMLDTEALQQVAEALAEAISQKIADQIVQQHGEELEGSLDMSMEEALEHIEENSRWDVPDRELPEMINHFAPDAEDINIWDRLENFDPDLQERTMDKVANIRGIEDYEYERQVA